MRLTPELVQRCYRPEPDPGPGPGFTPAAEADSAAAVTRLLDGHRGPVGVFAYGSLIWKPEFVPAARRRARLHGWHRSFCIRLTRWRGSAEHPGLMMALERGGSCAGLILQIPDATQGADLLALHRRELPHRQGFDMVRWTRVETEAGPERVLVFWAGPSGQGIEQRLPLETVATRLAHACGHGGSGADYLYNTVAHLEAEGIRDRNLWRLQALVADEIARWPAPAAG